MKSATANLLRGAGLLFQMICVVGYMRVRDRPARVADFDARNLLLAGMAVGFAVWLAGVVGLRMASRRPNDERGEGGITEPRRHEG